MIDQERNNKESIQTSKQLQTIELEFMREQLSNLFEANSNLSFQKLENDKHLMIEKTQQRAYDHVIAEKKELDR